MKLIFAGDPMCSWCYGFGKELTALMALHPSLPLQILVGGVRRVDGEWLIVNKTFTHLAASA